MPYAPAADTFTTGTKYTYHTDALYVQQNVTGRWLRFDFVTSGMDGWNTSLYPQGAALVGDTAFDVTYRDGPTQIVYVHMILNSSTIHLRQMVI